MSTPDTELAARTRAVLDAAAGHVFGTEPGRLAAELHDVLVRTTDDGDRARVAAALARCWVYGGHAERAAELADEAVARAERSGDPELVADSLDARLAAHWGPDELGLRTEVAARLEEVAAHVLDPAARLRAHLWELHVACERLHVPGMHRHLRALEQLGGEWPRARFFALTRRWMYDALTGHVERAPEVIAAAEGAAADSGLADGWMVLRAMRGYTALLTDDLDTCAAVAEQMERFARSEGVPAVAAEAAWVWVGARRPDRVRSLLGELDGAVLQGLTRDVNFLLTVQCALEAALYVEHDVAAAAAGLLTPYEGRAVFNAGSTNFHGVTDDTLARAAALTGDPVRAAALRDRALTTYERIGAPWWHARLRAWQPTTTVSHPAARSFRFHPTSDGLWLVGQGAGRPVRELRGMGYLHRLLTHPEVPVPAIELASGGRGTVVQPPADTVIDRQAATAYRTRLSSIDEELDEAQRWADLGRLDRLSAERRALLDELAAASGLGGRLRGTGSTRERARVAATKAIATAIDRVALVDDELGRHLRAAVRTGSDCSYSPARGDRVAWVLSE